MGVKDSEKPGYSLLPYWGFLPAARDIALKRLAGAIIGQAAADARQDDQDGKEAQKWLLSADCMELCEFIGLDHNAVRKWVKSGCTDWRNLHERTRTNTHKQ